MTRPLRHRAPWRRVFAALVATALLTASSLAHSEAATRGFLWKISGHQGVVYLAGSIHLMPESFYPLAAAFDDAFKESDLLVEEINLGELTSVVASFATLSRAFLPEGQSLDTVLSAGTYAALSRHLADVGAPIEPFKRMKPWMIAMSFETLELQKAGYDPAFGLDQHFYDLAESDGKSVDGLETAEFQLALMDGMPMDQQDRMLADTLKELDTEVANMNKIGDAWKRGDAATFERLMLLDLKQDPLIYKKMVVDRTRSWVPKIDALLARRGRAFVVVGAGHLVGPDGLLALLKAKGYTVEQM